jgi:hypothetical protein
MKVDKKQEVALNVSFNLLANHYKGYKLGNVSERNYRLLAFRKTK